MSAEGLAMSKEAKDAAQKAIRVNPYTVPEGQHGWRGLGLEGNHKRKWYTVLHNEHVLVTALITLPGETSVRHSHESGELSIHYVDKFQPFVTWHPGGELHGGTQEEQRPQPSDAVPELMSDHPEVKKVLAHVRTLEREIKNLEKTLQRFLKPDPAPRLLIDILFPPFKTTVDDPRFPPRRTIVGQWYD
jgi:hypothetical protein